MLWESQKIAALWGIINLGWQDDDTKSLGDSALSRLHKLQQMGLVSELVSMSDDASIDVKVNSGARLFITVYYNVTFGILLLDTLNSYSMRSRCCFGFIYVEAYLLLQERVHAMHVPNHCGVDATIVYSILHIHMTAVSMTTTSWYFKLVFLFYL